MTQPIWPEFFFFFLGQLFDILPPGTIYIFCEWPYQIDLRAIITHYFHVLINAETFAHTNDFAIIFHVYISQLKRGQINNSVESQPNFRSTCVHSFKYFAQ